LVDSGDGEGDSRSVTIGDLVRRLRDAAGQTQQELAARAGVALSVLTKLEQGMASDPRLSTVRAQGVGQGVTLDELAGPGSGAKGDK
jgi:transcriptional regulator with XRE-family HTH domain